MLLRSITQVSINCLPGTLFSRNYFNLSVFTYGQVFSPVYKISSNFARIKSTEVTVIPAHVNFISTTFPRTQITSCWRRTLSASSTRLQGPLNETTMTSEAGKNPGNDGTTTSTSAQTTGEQGLSRRDKLKKAIRDYGATVLVFHITMSLCSLGMFYLLVSSGLDMVEILGKMGVGEQILQSKVTQGASTFVIAYAVHKVFAPVRITITLTATPLIVKKLRSMGILKMKSSSVPIVKK